MLTTERTDSVWSVIATRDTTGDGASDTVRRSGPVRRPLPLWYSIALGALLVGATLYGLLATYAYRVADDVAAQGRGQDLLTLLVVPVLIWAASAAHRGSFRAHLLWLGLLAYVTYTYASYAFGVPFNDAFLLYVAALGLASFGLVIGLVRIDVAHVAPAFSATPRRSAAWLLFVSGGAFAVLWLSDIVGALPGGLPESRMAYDLPNPIHVLDLAWLIPVAILTGVLLLRSGPAGPVLAAVLLVKLLTLSVAILFMAGFMAAGGEAIDVGMVGVFGVLGVVVAILLGVGATKMDP